MSDLPIITSEEAKRLLTPEKIGSILREGITEEALLGGKTVVNISGSRVVFNGHLGSGGTKEVYSVELDSQPYAMALCGRLDPPTRIIQKWYSALHEPNNTDRIRQMGFMVNERTDIVPVIINGYDFPALMMKRYQDHPYPIYDSKNRTNGKATTEVTCVEDCIGELQGVVQDIMLLVDKGVHLEKDCFNMCAPEGMIRLYFGDLGTAEFYRFCSDEIDETLINYARFARSAYINGHSHNVIDGNEFFKALCNDWEGEPLKTRLIQEIRSARSR